MQWREMNLSSPKVGEVWFVEFGFDEKPRWVLVLASRQDARLAVASVVQITTRYSGTPYEVSLPRVPWLKEQSHINAQSVQPVKWADCLRKAPGRFDSSVLEQVKQAVRTWLDL